MKLMLKPVDASGEKRAVVGFIRSTSAHWSREANKLRHASAFELALQAEARAAILDQIAVDIEFGQHHRGVNGS